MAVGGHQDWNIMLTPNDELMLILKATETDLKQINDFTADVSDFFSSLRVMVGWRIFENRVGVCAIVDNVIKIIILLLLIF